MAPLARLKKRAEFLEVAGKGRKWTTPGLTLQSLPRAAAPLRVGFTASKRAAGIAVARNRARRRLREAARCVLPGHAVPGDYVLVARRSTGTRAFAALVADLETALKRVGAWRGGAE